MGDWNVQNLIDLIAMRKVPKLKVLSVKVEPGSLRRILEALGSSHKLEELSIETMRYTRTSYYRLRLDGIAAVSVERLVIHGRIKVTAQLLNAFRGFQSIGIYSDKVGWGPTGKLDLKKVPLETIEKIRLYVKAATRAPPYYPLYTVRFSYDEEEAGFAGAANYVKVLKEFMASSGLCN